MEGVEGVGIKGGVAPPTTLLIVGRCAAIHAAHCFAIRGGLRPWGGGVRITYHVIIYGLVIVINNFSEKRAPAPGAKPPRELRSNEQRGWRRNAPQ